MPVDHGLRVAPAEADSVNGHSPSSGMRVRPMITAPAARSLRTTSESAASTVRTESVPVVVGSPASARSSLTAIGTPSSGASSPCARRSSASLAVCRAWSANTSR